MSLSRAHSPITVLGDVADIVLVEDEQRAPGPSGPAPARAAQPIGVQPAEVHALLEVHLHVAGRLDGPVPAVLGVHRVGRDLSRRPRGGLAGSGHSASPFPT